MSEQIDLHILKVITAALTAASYDIIVNKHLNKYS